MKPTIPSVARVNLKPGSFWADRVDLVRRVTMWNVYRRFAETGRFDAFRFEWKEGMPNRPHIFWDSDVAKWMEAVAYLCEKQREPEMEAIVDDVVEQIARNRMKDGYFNSYFGLLEPQNRFTRRGDHELYCFGHLLEAAIAYRDATGKERFYQLMKDYADLVYRIFYVEKSAAFFTPGHEEVELALVKLYRASGESKYLDLARYFVEARGTIPEENNLYLQSHLPIREQKTAEGHAVRACYFFSGAADVALEDGDDTLKDALKELFQNITDRRMYVTGAIGQNPGSEGFLGDYDLCNQTAYAETCANLSLSFFARRMSLLEPDSRYADVAETVLFNSFLSGMSLDGKSFFYSNPQEEQQLLKQRFESARPFLPADARVEVFNCSCCPPNVVRAIASVSDYIYSTDGDTVWMHQYFANDADFDCRECSVETGYPYDGSVRISWKGKPADLALRIPGWCRNWSLKSNGASVSPELKRGYATVPVRDGDTLELTLDLPVRFIEANPLVWEDAGRAVVAKGPIVYCLEAKGNLEDGRLLRDLRVRRSGEYAEETDPELGVPVLKTTGLRRTWNGGLYGAPDGFEEIPLTLIPYYAILNRGPTDLILWTLAEP
ncbi:MAG: glycoside hydrolase family 127 protein [Clostridia bacterium]|nr:glycoside hydrolase family 127 protein [Clostridia bacterium]